MTTTSSGAIDISTVTSKTLEERQYLASFPEYYALATVTENNTSHDNQNVLDHVIGVFRGLEDVLRLERLDSTKKSQIEGYLSEIIVQKSRREILMIATLLHDIAKIDTLVRRQDGTTSCPGHELIAAGRVKQFSERFSLNRDDEGYVERIVRYHGFISEILNLIIANGNPERYLHIFQQTVGDVAIELVLLMHADLLGGDLAKGDKRAYEHKVQTLAWMLDNLTLGQVV